MQREKKRGEKKQGMEGSLCAPGLSGVSCVFVFFSPSPPLPFFYTSEYGGDGFVSVMVPRPCQRATAGCKDN